MQATKNDKFLQDSMQIINTISEFLNQVEKNVSVFPQEKHDELKVFLNSSRQYISYFSQNLSENMLQKIVQFSYNVIYTFEKHTPEQLEKEHLALKTAYNKYCKTYLK